LALSNVSDEGIDILKRVDAALRQLVDKISGVQHIGPNREAPRRYYPFSGERPTMLTSAGGGATDMLLADVTRRGTGKRRLARDVENWLVKAQMADQLQILPVSDRHYEVKLRHPISGELVNYSDVGFGISQILPVLVAGYNLGPGALFMLEQPEIHLHPRAQSELGDFFLDLYQRRVQTIIETHSEHLIMRIQRHVASGKIRPEHVAVNYIFAAEGKKVAVRLRLNEDGIFTDPWPQGFFEERLGEALELARAPLVRDGDIG
jgi:predicted ATPase